MTRQIDIYKRYIIKSRGYKTPCWIWCGCIGRNGYGKVTITRDHRKKQTTAHRYYYEKFNGPIQQKLLIDHLCRIKSCVNPDHLEAVTNSVNTRRGKSAKITQEQVNEIRKMITKGVEQKLIANQFNVSNALISGIKSNRKWRERT